MTQRRYYVAFIVDKEYESTTHQPDALDEGVDLLAGPFLTLEHAQQALPGVYRDHPKRAASAAFAEALSEDAQVRIEIITVSEEQVARYNARCTQRCASHRHLPWPPPIVTAEIGDRRHDYATA